MPRCRGIHMLGRAVDPRHHLISIVKTSKGGFMADLYEFPKSKTRSLEDVKSNLIENFIANGLDPAIAEATADIFEKPLEIMQTHMPSFYIDLDDLYLFSDLTQEQYKSLRDKFMERVDQAMKGYAKRANKIFADVFIKCMMIYAYELSKKTWYYQILNFGELL